MNLPRPPALEMAETSGGFPTLRSKLRMNLIELCEHTMSIPLHSTLDDWSRNVNDVKHMYVNLLLEARGTHIRMPRTSVRSVVIIFKQKETTQNRRRGRGLNTSQPMMMSRSERHVICSGYVPADWWTPLQKLQLELLSLWTQSSRPQRTSTPVPLRSKVRGREYGPET